MQGHTGGVDANFARLIKVIADRHPNHARVEQSWLANKLGVDVQVVNNWSRRGIPASRMDAIGKLLGLTYGQVAGTELVPPPVPDWPLDPFIDRARWANARPEHRSAAAHAAMLALDRLEAGSALEFEPGKRLKAV